MKIFLAAIVVYPCYSPIQTEPALSMTIVHACPNTVVYRWEERPETDEERAKQKYYWSLPRDDRQPLPAVEEKPKAEVKKAAKKKLKRKKKKRRG